MASDESAAVTYASYLALDDVLAEWRYRHVKMVERTMGDKAGTGGSSGATLFEAAFPDLWAVRRRL